MSHSLQTVRTVPPKGALLVTALAAVAYTVVLSVASLTRHRLFVTGGYDLGIFDQAVWLLGHGHEPFSTIRGRNLFADHFQPALALFAPLGRFGLSPGGLLIAQSALLAATALGLALLASIRGASDWLAASVGLLWLASPLVQWANLFDYHPETAVPLLLVVGAILLERDHLAAFAGTALLACCFKEDVPLVYLFWGIVIALGGRRRFGGALALASAAWFVLVTNVVIPELGGNFGYYSARFAGDRGSSVGAVLVALVAHPIRSASEVATPSNAAIVIALVASTGGLALLAPRMLLLAVPPVAANVLSAYSYQHDLHFHYELVPAAVFALASAYGAGVAARRLSPRALRALPAVLTAGAVVFTLAFSPALKTLRHTSAPRDATAIRHALAVIPSSAPVAAAPDVVAHLAHRRDVYQLPEPFFSRPTNGETWSDRELRRRANDVRYVLYSTGALDPYPKEQTERLPKILLGLGFRTVFREDDVRVFRRG